MGLIILIGKSGSGKDAVQNALVNDYGFERIVTATTRPVRDGEVNGVDYFFMSKEAFENGIKNNEFIEHRKYSTLVGGHKDIWYYGSPKQELSPDKDYVIILDVQGARDYTTYYGEKNCTVIQLQVNDEVREQRAMQRGSFDKTEWDRRLADDKIKFSKDKTADIIDGTVSNEGDFKETCCKVYDLFKRKDKQERKITMERKNVTAEIGKKYVHKSGFEVMCIGFDKDTKNPVMQNTATLWTCCVSGLGQYDNETIDWDYSTHGRFAEQLGSAGGLTINKENKDFVPVYKGNWEIIENRELYIANVAENRRFASTAKQVIGNGLKPRDSVKSLTEQYGFERTAWLTALNIVAHPLDGRFYQADKEWACKVLSLHFEVKPDEMFMNNEEKKSTFDKLINGGTLYSIHNTHLAQFAEALMPEYEKYLKATGDNLSDDEPLDLTEEQNNTRR